MNNETLNTSAFKVKLENFFYEVEETTFKTKEDAIKFLRESEGNDFYTKSELLEIKQNTTKGEIKMKKETKQYKLMRMCDGKMGWGTDWEMQITGSMNECKDYQYQDRIECEFCNPEYKIIPVD